MQLQLFEELQQKNELQKRLHAAEKAISRLEKQMKTPSPKRKRSISVIQRDRDTKSADSHNELQKTEPRKVSNEAKDSKQQKSPERTPISESMDVDGKEPGSSKDTEEKKERKNKKGKVEKTQTSCESGSHQPAKSAAPEIGLKNNKNPKQLTRKSTVIKGTAQNDELSQAFMPDQLAKRQKKNKRKPPAVFLFGLNDKATAGEVLQWFSKKGVQPKKVSKLKVERRGSAFCVSFNSSDIEKCLKPDFYPQFMRVKKWKGQFPQSDRVVEFAPVK